MFDTNAVLAFWQFDTAFVAFGDPDLDTRSLSRQASWSPV